jgi:hypothetical protein
MSMMPRKGEIDDALIKKFKDLRVTNLTKADGRDPFNELVQKGIELLER